MPTDNFYAPYAPLLPLGVHYHKTFCIDTGMDILSMLIRYWGIHGLQHRCP